MNPARLISGLSIIILIATGCSKVRTSVKESNQAGKMLEILFAQRFTVEKINGYEVLTIINPWQGAVNVNQKYYLVKRSERYPVGIDTSLIVRVPVRKIISMSTTYLSMIYALGEENSIIGISGSDLLFSKTLSERVKRGEVADVGYEDNLNKELVIRLAPDLVMVYGVGGEASGYLNKLHDLGIKVMFNADYLEDEPLGKAEWIKVFGALYCKEEEAESLFRTIAGEYDSIRSQVNNKISYRPKVLLGMPWRDTWYISPGNSFVSRLIMDSGGDYLWNDTKSETSMPFGLENVWMKARKADYWLNISTINNPDEILNVDYRLGELDSFKNGNLFNNNKRVGLNGGNDYWESGSMNPQVILKDIAAILHPEIFPGYDLYYYKKIK